MLEIVDEWLIRKSLDPNLAYWVSRGIALIVILILAAIANFVAKQLIVRGLSHIITRTEAQWDDILLERNVLNRIANFAPVLVVDYFTPFILKGYNTAIEISSNMMLILMILLGMLAIDAILNAVVDIYRHAETSRKLPIRGLIQLLKLVLFFLGSIFIVSIALGKSPVYLVSGLGALTAILILIFKDTILGSVAGIQLLANRMVARGDWIELPQHGADGDVIEVTLTTVKVQNWDKTITTIPTYALISESFKNWHGMTESGGRRIKRAINIDINSIKFCSEETLERFSKIEFISDYLNTKQKEIIEYNTHHNVIDECLINGRRLTNLGTFRAYVIAYLKQHPMINKNMTFLVRQLAPSEYGLPIEIYVFCRDKVWANYEAIQADIFDHILAVVPEFDLNVFQLTNKPL